VWDRKSCPGRLTSHERSGHSPLEERVLSSSSLDAIVKHDGRLDLLGCLIDGESLTVSQLSARVGQSLTEAAYHVKLLGLHGLVEKTDDPNDRKPLYMATLDGHPDWVREAIEAHRRRRFRRIL
jgi:DNA-binding transcriptional ArsR family regulator